MAKITKSGLKSIVKECLVEILSEGISSEKINKQKTNVNTDVRREEEKRLAEHRQKFEYKVENAVSSLTEDSVMAEILRDTAKNTLQEQIEDKSGLAAPGRSSGVDLGQLFGNTATNWEKLAFENEKG